MSDQFRDLCNEKGIQHQLSIPRTPQQNGVVEQRNRTLLEMVRSMMAQAHLPITFWGDSLLTATFILNQVPTKSIASTLYELWTGRKPNLSVLKPWGCAAYVHDSSHKYEKLGPRGKKSIFMRYSDVSKGYVFISQQETGSVTEFQSRDVTFLENEFPKKGEISQDLSLFETIDQHLLPSCHSSGWNLEDDELVSHLHAPIPSSHANESDPSPNGSFLRINESQLRRSNRTSIPRH